MNRNNRASLTHPSVGIFVTSGEYYENDYIVADGKNAQIIARSTLHLRDFTDAPRRLILAAEWVDNAKDFIDQRNNRMHS